MKQRDYDEAFNVLGNALCQDPVNPKALLTLAAEMQVHIIKPLLPVIKLNFDFIEFILYPEKLWIRRSII